MTGLLRAELTKAWSTRMLGWSVALGLALPPVLAALLGLAMGSRETYCADPANACRNVLEPPDETVAMIGVLGDGVPGAALTVCAAFAAAVLLVETRHQTISTTFLVTSRRWRVVAAKIVLLLSVSLSVVFVGTMAAGWAFATTAGPAGRQVAPLSLAALDVAVRAALVVSALALIAFAVAAMTRLLWVTAAVVVAWPTFLETLLPALLPGGEDLVTFLPVANARHFVGLDAGPIAWSPGVSGAYVTLLALGLAAAGTWRLSRADMPRAA